MEKIIIYQGENILGYANIPLWKKLDEGIKSKIHRWMMMEVKREEIDTLKYIDKSELIEVLYTTLEQNSYLSYHTN